MSDPDDVTAPAPVWKPWCGLEALYLGEIIVGRVAPDGGRKNGPRGIFNLDGASSCWHNLPNENQAKAYVEQRLAQWLYKAGLG